MLRRIVNNQMQCGQTGKQIREVQKYFRSLSTFCHRLVNSDLQTCGTMHVCTVWHNAVHPLKLAFFPPAGMRAPPRGVDCTEKSIQPSSSLTFEFDQTCAIFQSVAPVDLKRKLLVSTKHLSYQNIKRHIHTQTF